MGISVFPAAGGGSYTLKQTITSTGSVTIPASQGFVYAKIGSSETAVTAEGWVPSANTYSLVGSLYYYSWLVGSGPNLYIYY
jgi:hypothetical protein